jgi:2-polyprenyl-3-methyl-5-hydroxy-6-metoxy-1,4-benzoquinol methylase
MTNVDWRQIREYHDKIASTYDSRFRRENDLIDRREKEILHEQLGDLQGKRVLDFGCGTGRLCSFHLAAGAARVVGVDVSPQMIEIAQRKIKEPAMEFHVYVPKQEKSGFDAAGGFDVVSALEVFEYYQDPHEFLSIIKRNLSTGGLAVFDYINRHNLSARLKSYLSQDWRKNGIRLYRLKDVVRLCNANGLEITESHGVFMSLLPISFVTRIPYAKQYWLGIERRMDRSRLLRRWLSYRTMVTAKIKT